MDGGDTVFAIAGVFGRLVLQWQVFLYLCWSFGSVLQHWFTGSSGALVQQFTVIAKRLPVYMK